MTKMIVQDLDFKKDGAHVALVTKGANQQEVLLMKKKTELSKAEEVKISTSMSTFLTTFFYMWRDEANELAEILGFEPQEWTYNIIGEDTTIELLKSLDEDSVVSKDLSEKINKMSGEFTKLIKQKEVEMAKKDDKKTEVDIEKTVKEAVKIALEKQTKETSELQKSLDDKEAELVDLRKAAEKKEKDEMVELCKGYSFVEDAEKLAVSLSLCKGIEGFDIILETLEKAREAIKASLETELGTDEEADLNKKNDNEDNVDKTTELLKKRNAKETK